MSMVSESRFHGELAIIFLVLWVITGTAIAILYSLSLKATVITALFNLWCTGNFLVNMALCHAYRIAGRFLGEVKAG